MYADDICLLDPTASAMQYLIDVCYHYSIEHDNLCNPIKTSCTIFKSNSYNLDLSTVFIGSNRLNHISDKKYLAFMTLRVMIIIIIIIYLFIRVTITLNSIFVLIIIY